LPVSRGADKNLQIVATGVESCREYYVKPLKELLVHWTRVQKQACFSQKKAGIPWTSLQLQQHSALKTGREYCKTFLVLEIFFLICF
jgi:hypothetical protein